MAVYWYTKAAEQGNDLAQHNLGLCYKYGRGTEKDLDKAIEWITKAAEKGNEKARASLLALQQNNEHQPKPNSQQPRHINRRKRGFSVFAQVFGANKVTVAYSRGIFLAKLIEWAIHQPKTFANFAAIMSTEIIHIEESEYNSILRQAVAVIDKARTNAAKSVSCIANTAYWEIN